MAGAGGLAPEGPLKGSATLERIDYIHLQGIREHDRGRTHTTHRREDQRSEERSLERRRENNRREGQSRGRNKEMQENKHIREHKSKRKKGTQFKAVSKRIKSVRDNSKSRDERQVIGGKKALLVRSLKVVLSSAQSSPWSYNGELLAAFKHPLHI